MPQRLLTAQDLRAYGLTVSDVCGRPRALTETWRLPEPATRMLRDFLSREGFDPSLPIHVHAADSGFFLTQ